MEMEVLRTKWKAKILTVSQSASNKGAAGEDSTSFSIRNIPVTQGQEIEKMFLKTMAKGMN